MNRNTQTILEEIEVFKEELDEYMNGITDQLERDRVRAELGALIHRINTQLAWWPLPTERVANAKTLEAKYG